MAVFLGFYSSTLETPTKTGYFNNRRQYRQNWTEIADRAGKNRYLRSEVEKMYINRILTLQETVSKKSCFLWGPRQTGKSSLLAYLFPGVRYYNLLYGEEFLRLNQDPGLLRRELTGYHDLVIIDEIQRVPDLLNEVHALIESSGTRFILTGSNARKLRRGGVNLLGGRARSKSLHPFVWGELGGYDLAKVMHSGLIPSIFFSDSPEADLSAYGTDYLREEIISEGASRNIPAFSRFLHIAALSSGQQINATKIGNDAQVARTTVQEYFEILKSTLIAHELGPWKMGLKRKATSTSKIYLFDVGVTRYLQGRKNVIQGTPEFGHLFEQLIFQELQASLSYGYGTELKYWRSESGLEVDFILDDHTAIEVKACAHPTSQDLKGLRAIEEEAAFKRRCLVCQAPRYATHDSGIEIIPWEMFLQALWMSKNWENLPLGPREWQLVSWPSLQNS